MKKLIFLLILAVVFTGFALAYSPAQPPGVLTLEAALFGDIVDGYAVIPDTILVSAVPVMAEPSSLQAVMALYNYDESAIQPWHGGAILVINTGQLGVVFATDAGYHLRC